MYIHDIAIGTAALAAVLGLIWLAARVARAGGLARTPQSVRLRVVQSVAVDTRRRAVLIALDGREILLLTGGANDLVIALTQNAAAPGAVGLGAVA